MSTEENGIARDIIRSTIKAKIIEDRLKSLRVAKDTFTKLYYDRDIFNGKCPFCDQPHELDKEEMLKVLNELEGQISGSSTERGNVMMKLIDNKRELRLKMNA